MATRVGLRMPDTLTFHSWERAGRQLTRIVDSSSWCMGDWLVYGQERYADRYRQAIEMAGLDYQTLRNYAWVARRIGWERRHEKLSFQHHAEVAALPPDEQQIWLTRAEQHGWSKNQLRSRLREDRRAPGQPMDATGQLPRLSAPLERIELWREAARKSSCDFEHWMLTALDSAASQQLAQ